MPYNMGNTLSVWTGDICVIMEVLDNHQTVDIVKIKYFPGDSTIAIPGNHDNENYQQVFGTKGIQRIKWLGYTILHCKYSWRYGNANGTR